MDARFSDEQELLRESARDFLARECPMSLVREVSDDGKELPAELWSRLAELGWLGLALPAEHGGAGLGALELAIVLEETGRVLLPGPFFSAVALGASAVALAGTPEQRARLLPPLAAGRRRATLALLDEGGSWEAAGVRAVARREGADGALRVDGAKRFVLDAQGADALVVPVRLEESGSGDAELALAWIDARAEGVSIRCLDYVDATRRPCHVDLSDVRVAAEDVLGAPGTGGAALARILDRARVALCAETCGGAARVLELAVEYAKTREQFGRPIGSFQAIQHRCADMLSDVEAMRSATWYAAWAVASGAPDAHRAACMAKAYCADAGPRVAGAGIQIFGGQGFTWEQDLHLYYKRAKAAELQLGDATWHRELVARELVDGRPGPERDGR